MPTGYKQIAPMELNPTIRNDILN
jgi:hypothetical protein